MAEAKLNFDEDALDKSSDIYILYDRLYQGMQTANEVEAPTLPSADDLLVKDGNGNATFDNNGNPILDTTKESEINQIAADYSDIMMKNSAYLFANSIMSVMSGATGSGGGATSTGFVSRGGDSMKGLLSAQYGFSAGLSGQKIFEVTIDSSNKNWAIVSGCLCVTENAEVNGLLKLGEGIAFGGYKSIYLDNGSLAIDYPYITLKGNVTVDGTLTLGDIIIDQNGVSWNGHEFYHSGNSNKSDVDWTMKDANIYGALNAKGNVDVGGKLIAHDGFSLGALKKALLYSETKSSIDGDGNVQETAHVVLESDLKIINDHGLKFGDDYIITVRGADAVSFSAPGMRLRLGDSDNGRQTFKISLQSDIWDYADRWAIITKKGAGRFMDGFMAGYIASGPLFSTYYYNTNDKGVLIWNRLRFTNSDGPVIYSKPEAIGSLFLQLPYQNTEVDGTPTEQLKAKSYYAQTTSPFRNLSLPWSATLHFDTEGEFFAFDKPIESECFAIKSDQYHTRLIEDALFFDDGKFIEGVADGLRFAGNGYFDGNISSPSFASGFAGYGWAVKDEITNGGYHATFDTLTIRKKMRVYELEVQKLSYTNGSLWVSDYCSGDEVIAID